jgi:hypothetical protein
VASKNNFQGTAGEERGKGEDQEEHQERVRERRGT